jgi:hypothetical protein
MVTTTTTTTTPPPHRYDNYDRGIVPLRYYTIPNEKVLILIFIRAMSYPDLLLLESNHSIWWYLQQQLMMMTMIHTNGGRGTSTTTTMEESASPLESSIPPPPPSTLRQQQQYHLKRMIQAATLTFQKENMIQIQKEVMEQQQQQQQLYHDTIINDSTGSHSTSSFGTAHNYFYRRLLDRLLFILDDNSHGCDGVRHRTYYNDSEQVDHHPVVAVDPWDQFFWKTIQQYS